jgi:hypothetical protein
MALDASMPFDQIRSAERILRPGEDWRWLGTDRDPVVQATEPEVAAGG